MQVPEKKFGILIFVTEHGLYLNSNEPERETQYTTGEMTLLMIM